MHEQEDVNIFDTVQNTSAKSKSLNNIAVWQVRKKHLLIWSIIACVLAIAIIWTMREGQLLIMLAVCVPGYAMFLLWFLAPISITKAENGSYVSALARKKLFCSTDANNKPTIASSGVLEEGLNLMAEAGGVYNLNNPLDSMMFGARIAMLILWPIIWIVKIVFPIFPKMISASINIMKNILCYLVVMIPFPITTGYWYIKSREKLTIINIGIPIILILLVYFLPELVWSVVRKL